MKLVHKFSGDPVTHTQAWSQSLHPFLNLCVLWQWLGVQTGQKYLPVCVGAKPITYGPGPMSPHTSHSCSYANMYLRLISDVG